MNFHLLSSLEVVSNLSFDLVLFAPSTLVEVLLKFFREQRLLEFGDYTTLEFCLDDFHSAHLGFVKTLKTGLKSPFLSECT